MIDNYFGTEIPDPYRWLEDDMSEETTAWVKAQNEVTFAYLEKIPFRNQLRERMSEIWNYPKMGTPGKEAGYYVYSYNTGLQNHDIIYIKKDLHGNGWILLDPNTFSEDGTVALSAFRISNNSKYLAYGLSRAGSDWMELYVKEVESGKELRDHLEWIKFSDISWYKDGFFYTRYEEPMKGDKLKGENKNARIFYHRVGTAQAEDILIHKDDSQPDWGFNLGVTEDEQFMLLSVTKSTSGNALAFKKAGLENQAFTWIDRDFDNDYHVIGNKDNNLYILTNLGAPMYKLIGIDLNNPDRKNWMDVIPEQKRTVLESVILAGGKIIASYLQDAYNMATVHELNGQLLHEISLPGLGSLEGFKGKLKDNIAFYSFSSFTYPSAIFKYDVVKNRSEIFYSPLVDFDVDAFETKQVFYSSKDGTRVPMFIVHKKGIEMNGTNPTLLSGYGGFNITSSPSFSPTRTLWFEQGGVFALANIRGGG